MHSDGVLWPPQGGSFRLFVIRPPRTSAEVAILYDVSTWWSARQHRKSVFSRENQQRVLITYHHASLR